MRCRLVGLDQLEAAFEIADTDGDGVLDSDEIEEALHVRYSDTHTCCATSLMHTMYPYSAMK